MLANVLQYLRRKVLWTVNHAYTLATMPCRMNRPKPEVPDGLCGLCVMKGGWLRCRKSRKHFGGDQLKPVKAVEDV